MMEVFTGPLTEIKQAETLLIWDKEVHRIRFSVQGFDGKPHKLAAVSDEGTAYYFLEYDQRFREGTAVRAYKLAGLCVGIGLADDDTEPTMDISELKDKAQDRLYFKRAELHALYHAFDSNSPQAYAIAVQLKRQHRDRSYAVSDKVCRCDACHATFELESPRYTYRFGTSRCARCEENVSFTRVDALPKEETETLSLDEVQRRLSEKFGGA